MIEITPELRARLAHCRRHARDAMRERHQSKAHWDLAKAWLDLWRHYRNRTQ